MDELLKPREVAALLKTTSRKVGELRRCGRLRTVILGAKQFRYRRRDVEVLIRESLAPVAQKRD
jgi:hypothetical protein